MKEEIENDKEIVELIRETSKDLRELNFDLKQITKKGYLFQEKVFLDEGALEEYIKEHMSELEDFYTKDMLDDLTILHREEVEEVEVIF